MTEKHCATCSCAPIRILGGVPDAPKSTPNVLARVKEQLKIMRERRGTDD